MISFPFSLNKTFGYFSFVFVLREMPFILGDGMFHEQWSVWRWITTVRAGNVIETLRVSLKLEARTDVGEVLKATK